MFRVPYLPLLAAPLLALAACSGAGDLFTAAGTLSGGANGEGGAGASGAGEGGAVASAGASVAGAAGASRAGAGAGGSAGSVVVSPVLPAEGGGAGQGPAPQAGGGGGPVTPPLILPLQVDGVCKGKVVLAAASIDDFEQGMNGWATYIDDQFGAPVLSAPGAALSGHAATFSGGTANVSGVYHPQRCNDVSAFTGISFWAKGRGGDHVRFLAVIPATQPQLEGGDCDPASATCWDHPGHLFELSDHWQQYHVAWQDLAQYGWGTPATFGGVLNSVLWINDGPVGSFELSLDEVRLYAGNAP